LPNHSRATTSKLFAALLIRADFIALRFSAGFNAIGYQLAGSIPSFASIF
jgi:hypothetical protein